MSISMTVRGGFGKRGTEVNRRWLKPIGYGKSSTLKVLKNTEFILKVTHSDAGSRQMGVTYYANARKTRMEVSAILKGAPAGRPYSTCSIRVGVWGGHGVWGLCPQGGFGHGTGVRPSR